MTEIDIKIKDEAFDKAVAHFADLVAQAAVKKSPHSELKSETQLREEHKAEAQKQMCEFRDRFSKGYRLLLDGVKKKKRDLDSEELDGFSFGSSAIKI